MNGLRTGLAMVLGAGALVAAIASCSRRPLPFDEGAGGGASGRGGSGHAGSGGSMTGLGGGPGLQLLGERRLLLDNPSTGVALYTTLLWTGEEYLFVWRLFQGEGVFMQRLDASGQTIGGNMRLLDYADAVDLAWGGGRLAAVWKVTNSPAGSGLFFQTFDRLARPLTAEVKLRSSASSSFDGSVRSGPRIAPIKDGFAIVWNDSQVLVATVTFDGHAQYGPEAAGGDDLLEAPHLSLAARGDRIAVGWNGRPSGTPRPGLPTNMMVTRAFSDRLQALGSREVLDPACLAAGTHQLLATDGGFLALWTREARIAPVAIAQLDADGVPTTTATMESPVVGPYQDPAPAAWNGDHVVVLWDQSTSSKPGLTLARFSPDGTVQGQPIALPSMALASRLYLVAHDGTVGFIWSEGIEGASEVYFQQATSGP